MIDLSPNFTLLLLLAIASLLLWLVAGVGWQRLRLSRAKHPSLQGHSKMSRMLARLLPYYTYDAEQAFACDQAPSAVTDQRRSAFYQLAEQLEKRYQLSHARSLSLQPQLSDLQFTDAYRVPFQFRELVSENLPTGHFAVATAGVRMLDLDGNWTYDLAGSYGVNLLGYDFYKHCITEGSRRVEALGPVLGSYHPLVAENVERIRQISGLDEVSFHMSGTEAVMQAVRLARYHTRRNKLVMFCGSYHGWWDGVQPGVGNPRKSTDVLLLRDMHHHSLRVLQHRKDLACVLINPLQAMHPNRSASSDGMLISSDREARFDRAAYTQWLSELRTVCTKRGIPLILDEVFMGFRLGLGGAQEYFSVKADLVTYGKTLGGGLPVGVLCGSSRLMKRYRDDRPLDICFARGTFNSHPYVMGSMNVFLQHASGPEFRTLLDRSHELWDTRARLLNARLEQLGLPLRVVNMASVWQMTFSRPSRYNWLLQFYLRNEGLNLSWVGTGRLIFSLDYSEEDFAAVQLAIIRAAEAMSAGGWWWESSTLSNKSIKRRVMRELISEAFRQYLRTKLWPNSGLRLTPPSDPLAAKSPRTDTGMQTDRDSAL